MIFIAPFRMLYIVVHRGLDLTKSLSLSIIPNKCGIILIKSNSSAATEYHPGGPRARLAVDEDTSPTNFVIHLVVALLLDA